MLENHCEAKLFSIKLHLSDHLKIEFNKFGKVRFQDAYVLENSSVGPENAYW